MLSPAVRSTDQHALRHEVIQAIGEDVAGDTEALLKALEPADAEHGVTKDEQRPALPDDLQGTGDRANLIWVTGIQHCRMVVAVSCITQLMCYGRCITQLLWRMQHGSADPRPAASEPVARNSTFPAPVG